MAEESQDDASKTEEPSQKKLEEAHKKGQLISSREVSHFFMLLALTFFILGLAPGMARGLFELLSPFITQPDEFQMSPADISIILERAMKGMLLVLAVPLLITVAGAIAPTVLQNKWVFSVESIKPKWEKLSLFNGFGRLFGLKALVEFLRNLLKITVVGIATVMVVLPYRDQLELLPDMNKLETLVFTQRMAGRMLVAAVIIVFLLSIFDYLYQRFIFMKRMRMSKQEMKDEYKQQEGDPHVKQKLKGIRRERARKRMMANVPKADVIITNPTHFAVALKYDSTTMTAPKLLAKGSDEVAARIREVAAKHKIPIVRNPPLARVLYDTTDIDEEIPVEHYQAVAKVIGYVYKLQGKVPKKKPAAKGAKPTLHMGGGKATGKKPKK